MNNARPGYSPLRPRTRIVAAVAQQLPESLVSPLRSRPTVLFAIRISVLLLLFAAIEAFVAHAGDLNASAYQNWTLVTGLYERIGSWNFVGLAIGTALLARYGALFDSWHALDGGREARWFVVFVAAVLAWPLSAYEYNFYFDQGHYIDRFAIVALVSLIYLRPVFVFPYVLLAYLLLYQIDEPQLSFGAVFAHKLQLLHVLNAFAATMLIHALTGAARTRDFVFVVCCLIGAAYWVSVYEKWQLDWITHGQLHQALLAAWAHGWLGFVDAERIVAAAQRLSRFDIPLMLFVLGFQTAFVLMLWKRTVAMVLLIASILFHLGVFAVYGFLFWTWIMLNAALLALLFRDRNARRFDIFHRRHLVAGALLIAVGGFWAHPSSLGWVDTRLSYTYRIEALGASGRRYTLPPAFFAPYDDIFTLGNFRYLVPDFGILVGPYGVSQDRAQADRLQSMRNAGDILDFERDAAIKRYDPARSAQFYAFIIRFVRNRVADPGKGATLRSLTPPPQFWSSARDQVYTGQEPLHEVVVTSITSLYDGDQLSIIREHELARLAL